LEQRTYLAHPVELEPGSLLATLLETTSIPANTMHHQALQQIAPGLRVVGSAPDGIVEAVEGEGASYLIGVQCHPEELWNEAEPRWQRLFTSFVEASQRYAVSPAPVMSVTE
jgi:putative glutamine amidotransferase